MTIDGFVSAINATDHLAPVWRALPDDARGTLYAHTSDLAARCASLGVRAKLGAPKRADASLVLVAGAADMRAVRPRKVVLLNHGAGQTYRGYANSAHSGGRERESVVLHLCPSERDAATCRAGAPWAEAVAIGSPHVDDLLRDAQHATEAAPTVAISFHRGWPQGPPEAKGALAHYLPALASVADQLRARGFTVLGHGHPHVWSRLRAVWEQAGVEPVADFAEVVARADVYAVDNSSTLFEAAACGIPVVAMNAPWYRRDVEHGLRFWSEYDVGLGCDDPASLVAAVTIAYEDTPGIRARRAQTLVRVYDDLIDGHASERAAAAICDLLAAYQPRTR